MLHFGTEPRSSLHASSPYIVAHCTKSERNQSILPSLQYHKNKQNVPKFGTEPMLCLMHQQHMVLDYTKYEQTYNPFFSKISQQTHIENLPWLLQFRMEPNAILYAATAHGTWSWNQIQRKPI